MAHSELPLNEPELAHANASLSSVRKAKQSPRLVSLYIEIELANIERRRPEVQSFEPTHS